MSTFSVVMLTYDINPQLADFSLAAIDSLKQTRGEFEFVIVDNGSPYGAGAVRPNADIYIRNKENVGYPGAVNQGMKLSHGDFVAISNNDIKVTPNWLDVAEEVFKDPTVGSLHYRMIQYEEPVTTGNETWLEGKERWCTSSFFIIRRKAFESVGGYDEGYKEGGYDDWDFWHRVRHVNKWKTAYTNKAVYQHKDSSTYIAMDNGYNRTERDTRNREHFKSKFGEYAEAIWQSKYPEQMSQPYRPFP